jgi:hypothetical protein
LSNIVHVLPPFGFYEARIIFCKADIVRGPRPFILEKETYPCLEENDLVVGANEVSRAIPLLTPLDKSEAVLLLVRAPDGTTDWSNGTEENPPYVTPAAIRLLVDRFPNMRHLLTNLPSLDRRKDGGLVRSHRAFFAPDLRDDQSPQQHPRRSLTELLKVPTGDFWQNDTDGVVCIALAPIEGLDALPSSVYFRAHGAVPE